MKPATGHRRWIVMGALMAAIAGTDLVIGATHPYRALAVTVAALALSNVALPSAAWLRVRDFCYWIPWALADKRRKPASPPPAVPEDPEDAAQREHYGLDLAEYDARIKIGMPLGHLERLAYNLPNPEEWDEREAGPDLWPDGEWVDVIEEVRRERGWKP